MERSPSKPRRTPKIEGVTTVYYPGSCNSINASNCIENGTTKDPTIVAL